MSYRAVRCERLASSVDDGISSLRVVTLPSKKIGPEQLRIRVHAASVNFFDLLTLVGKYQLKPPMPFTPLTEGAGTVIEVGASAPGWKIGDRLCFNLWGPGEQGALSDEVIVDASKCHHLPASLSFAEGAGFLVGYSTAYHGLVHRANLQAGEWLVVTGASGGMGLAALQLGRVLGANLIAVGSDANKLAQVGKIVGLGADRLVTIGPGAKDLKDRIAAITNGTFADVVYENVGGEVFDACVRCMAPYGRLCVIGFAGGRIPSLPANLALVKGFSLVGVRAGAQLVLEHDKAEKMHRHLMQLAEAGALRPVIHTRVPFDRFAEAFRSLTTRKVIGKAIIEPTQPAKL